MSERQKFIDEVQSFIEDHDLYPSQFGIDAVGNPSFVKRLLDGQDVRLSTMEKVRAYMARGSKKKRAKTAA